jgi:hypothetical protein
MYSIKVIVYVPGERYVYKFVCDPEALFNMAYCERGSQQSQPPQQTSQQPPQSSQYEYLYGPYYNFQSQPPYLPRCPVTSKRAANARQARAARTRTRRTCTRRRRRWISQVSQEVVFVELKRKLFSQKIRTDKCI